MGRRVSEAGHKLTRAGFTVLQVYPGAKWFYVHSPGLKRGFVLHQANAGWHFFFKDCLDYTSSHNLVRCLIGRLEETVVTDSQWKTYRRLLRPENVPPAAQRCESVRLAMQEAAQEASCPSD